MCDDGVLGDRPTEKYPKSCINPRCVILYQPNSTDANRVLEGRWTEKYPKSCSYPGCIIWFQANSNDDNRGQVDREVPQNLYQS